MKRPLGTIALGVACLAVGYLLGRRAPPDSPLPGAAAPKPPDPRSADDSAQRRIAELLEENRRLREAAVSPAPGGEQAAAPDAGAAAEALAWLREVSPEEYGGADAGALLRRDAIALREKDLRADEGFALLRGLPELKSLDLSGSRLSKESLARVASLELETLVLDSAKVEGEALLPVGEMASLRKLVLARTDLADDVLRRLVAAGKLQALDTLILWNNFNLTDAGLAALPGLPRLRRLGLSGCVRIGDAGLAHVGRIATLEDLDVESCRALSDDGLRALSGHAALRKLDLAVLPITDEALRHLGGLPELRELKLRQSPVTGAGVGHLAGLPKLETLDLRGTRVEGLEQVRQLRALKAVDLGGLRIPDEEVRRFEADFPHAVVDR